MHPIQQLLLCQGVYRVLAGPAYLHHPAYVLNDGVASMMAEAKFGAAAKS